MRKALLTLVLSLVICFAANAEEQYRLERFVVGSGGFVGASVGDYKASGIVGQLIIGKSSGTMVTGDLCNVHNGFWVPGDDESTGIQDEIAYQSGVVNFPNPASNYTNFEFTLSEDSYVTLQVYDMMGKTIATILEDVRGAGKNNIEWNLRNSMGGELASGSYMYELVVSPITAGNMNNSRSYSLKNVVMISK